jgi:hypothetical protein
MSHYILMIFGFYLSLIGTWRIAQSTKPAGNIADIKKYSDEDKCYTQLADIMPTRLIAVIAWIFSSAFAVKNTGISEGVYSTIILPKQFDWGLRFLVIGIILSFLSNFF